MASATHWTVFAFCCRDGAGPVSDATNSIILDSADRFFSLDPASEFLHSHPSSSPAKRRIRRTNICVQPCSLRCKSADLVVLHLIKAHAGRFTTYFVRVLLDNESGFL